MNFGNSSCLNFKCKMFQYPKSKFVPRGGGGGGVSIVPNCILLQLIKTININAPFEDLAAGNIKQKQL